MEKMFKLNDVLRRRYKGRDIYRFVNSVKVPRLIKDEILLKPLLKCVPKDLLG